MPLLTQAQVLKQEVQSVTEFAKALSISNSAVYTACANDKLDYAVICNHRVIVMTKLTKTYKPNESPRRVKPVVKKGKQSERLVKSIISKRKSK